MVLRLGDALPVSLGGGPLLNTLLLAWDADRLLHGLQGWWDLPILHPYTHVLAFSENLLGIALFTAPIQWLTGNPVVVYNFARDEPRIGELLHFHIGLTIKPQVQRVAFRLWHTSQGVLFTALASSFERVRFSESTKRIGSIAASDLQET